MHEKKYHQVSPTLQCSDYQIFMCDTLLKKSLTKYHQVSPTFLVVIPYECISVYLLYISFLISMFMRFISQVSNFRLHPDLHISYTPVYDSNTPGCTACVHPGV